jgi:hypothetical protein
MSRLTADQESRGGDGDSGAGEEDSAMRMNLSEGCGAVNHETWRMKRENRLVSFVYLVCPVYLVELI